MLTSSSNNVGIFLPLPCSGQNPKLFVRRVKLDCLGKNLSKSPACSCLLCVVDVLKPDRDIALELCKAALKDKVDPARSCIVRDGLLCERDHASSALLAQSFQVHFVFDVSKKVGLLGDPTLESVLVLLALLQNGCDLFL